MLFLIATMLIRALFFFIFYFYDNVWCVCVVLIFTIMIIAFCVVFDCFNDD